MKYIGVRENHVGTFDIVLELAGGVTLATTLYRHNVAISWKRSTIYQLSDGLVYLHDRGIIHLDLKPPNILFRDRDLEQVLIADFGMATTAISCRRAGARKFRAPDYPFTQKSDVFSLASIACCILSGWNPSSQDATERTVAQVLLDQDSYPNWHDALRRGVHPDYYKRPSARDFRDTFALPPHSVNIESETEDVSLPTTGLFHETVEQPSYILEIQDPSWYSEIPTLPASCQGLERTPDSAEIEPQPPRTSVRGSRRCLVGAAIAIVVFVILPAFRIWLLPLEEARH